MSTFEKIEPLQIGEEDEYPPIHAFAADREGVYEDHIEEEESKNLRGCLGVLEDNGTFFRSESLDTPQKTIQFSKITKFAFLKTRKSEQSFRCACCQLGIIDREADLIMNQHLYIMKLNRKKVDPVPFAHLFLPTEPLYYTPLRERVFSTSLHDLEIISQQVSYEGLVTYGYWLSEEYEKIIPTINYAATEEYELEMRLNDFLHHARSDLIKSVKLEIVGIIEEMTTLVESVQGRRLIANESDRLIELEKQLINSRDELKGYIENIVKQLYNVQVAIEKIAVAHPELEQLYYSTILLKSMMLEWERPFSNWAQKCLVHSMMDQKLGVITLFNSYQNDNRSLFSFAIRYALVTLCNKETNVDYVEIVVNWYEYVRRLHKHHIKNGNYPPQDKRLKLVYALQKLILKVFLAIRKGKPITQGKMVNKEFISLLPVYTETATGDPLQILEIDSQTFEAIDFKGSVEEILRVLTD